MRVGALCAGLVALMLAACAADRPKPTALEPLKAKIAGREVWNTRLNPSILALTGSTDALLVPAARDGTFFVASGGGDVAALKADTGAELWRAQLGSAIAAGVGSDGRFASVVTRGNEVVTLEGGRLLWRKRCLLYTSRCV